MRTIKVKAHLLLVALASALVLVACNLQEMVANVAGEEDLAEANAVVDAVIARDSEALQALTHPDVRSTFSDEALQPVFDYLPDGAAPARTLTRANRFTNTSIGEGTLETVSIVMRLDYPATDETDARSFFISVRLQGRDGEPVRFVGLNVNEAPAPRPTTEAVWTPGFTSAVAIAMATAIFVVVTVVFVWLTPRLKRRILWTIFIILVCYPVFAYSSATGEWALVSPRITLEENSFDISLFNLVVLGAGWMRDMSTGHDFFEVAIPIGALLFYLQRMRGKLALKPATDKVEPNDNSPSNTDQG